MSPLLLVVIVLALVIFVLALMDAPGLGRVVQSLTAVALVLFIVCAARYLGWL